MKINNFLVSNKWIKSFCRRHKLSLRKIAHVGQDDNRRPEEQRDNAIEHLATLELMTADLNADMIFNMDETPVYIDMHLQQSLLQEKKLQKQMARDMTNRDLLLF